MHVARPHELPHDMHNITHMGAIEGYVVGRELPYARRWDREYEAPKRHPYKGMYTWHRGMWMSLRVEDDIYQPWLGGPAWAEDAK